MRTPKLLPKKLKIAYLTTSILDDPNRTQYQRPKYYALNNELFIFTFKNIKIPKIIEMNSNIIRSNFKLTQFTLLLYPIWCVYKVLKLYKKYKFDIVYSTYNYFSLLPGFILKLMRFLWVADIWDHPELPLKILYKQRKNVEAILKIILYIFCIQIIKKILKHANLLISAICPFALTEYNLDPKKIFEVTNGVDLNITRPSGIQKEDNIFKVFYVGFLMLERGIDTLLNAMKILKTKTNHIKLILIGDARKEDEVYFREIIRKHNLKKQVDYLGRLKHDSVLSLIEKVDVCILPFPRKKELDCIYPIKLFEYMAMGKAVVVTRLKGVSTIIEDGENGLLVKPDSPREMAEALLKIYHYPKLKKKLEINARKTAENYSWDTINLKINETIHKLMGNP